MSEPAGKAVFLSYASQDAEAARHIADALRASGVEVWFDQSELRGGDAWDANIRKQIKDCTLFIPIISANTQARAEGYFRREWRLAVERMHDLADDQPFLLPVVIDDTSSVDARVPERFRERQWTRLPGGEANPAFVDRVRALVRSETREHSGSASGRPETLTRSAPRKARVWWLAGIAVALTIAATVYLFRAHPPGPAPIATTSEAQQLVARARAMYERGGESHTREDFATAEQLVAQARTLEPNNDEVWATAARIDTWFVFYRFDTSESRKQQARTNAARALKLAPHGFEARRAQAGVLLHVVALPAVRPEAERLLRTLSEERPHDLGVLNSLGLLLREDGRFDEAATFFLRAKDPGSAAWTYYHAGRFEEASAAVDEVLVTNRTVANLLLKSMIEHVGREDLDAAQATLDQLPAAALLEDDAASAAVILRIYRREPEKALEILRAIPRDFLASNWFTGPKAYLTGWAHDLAGRKEAAQADWRVALSVVGQRLAATPNDPDLLNWKAYLLSVVGERDEAERILRLYQQLSGVSDTEITFDSAWIYLGLGRRDEVIAWLSSVLQGPKRDPFMHAYARFDPDFDPLRSDPRFEALLRDTLPKGAKPFPEQKTEDGDPKTVPP